MPFKEVNVTEIINNELRKDPEFKRLWNESRTEYRLIGELVKIRKEKGLSQAELASRSGNRQQVISRIEKRENSPTLKTFCSLLDVLGYDIKLVPKKHNEDSETPHILQA